MRVGDISWANLHFCPLNLSGIYKIYADHSNIESRIWLSKFNLQWLNLAFFRGYKHIDIAAFDERLFVAVGDVFYELPDLF